MGAATKSETEGKGCQSILDTKVSLSLQSIEDEQREGGNVQVNNKGIATDVLPQGIEKL